MKVAKARDMLRAEDKQYLRTLASLLEQHGLGQTKEFSARCALALRRYVKNDYPPVTRRQGNSHRDQGIALEFWTRSKLGEKQEAIGADIAALFKERCGVVITPVTIERVARRLKSSVWKQVEHLAKHRLNMRGEALQRLQEQLDDY